jgi:uncharacterized protein YjcR
MCRISVPTKEQIRKLYLAGYSLRGLSKALGLSRNTVRKYLRKECEQAESKRVIKSSWAEALDWEMLALKRQQGVSIKQLHKEYAPDHVPYSTFADRLRKHVKPLKMPSIHLVHNPAEKTQIDYCDGIYPVDPKRSQARR